VGLLRRYLSRFLGRFLGGAFAAAADRQQHLALAGGGLLRLLALGLLRGRGGLLFAGEAALERVHQVDHVATGLRGGLWLGAEAVAFLVDQVDQRLLGAVLELHG